MPDRRTVLDPPVRTHPAAPVRAAIPPPRPPVTSALALPGSFVPPPPPRAIRIVTWLWALCVVAGGVALIVSVVDLEGLRAGLLDTARSDDPDAADDLIGDGAVVTMTSIALFCDAMLLLMLWGLRLIGLRKHSALWVLLPVGVLTLIAVDLAQGMVDEGATGIDRLAFLVQGGLVVVATVALLTRPSRAWLRPAPDGSEAVPR